MTDEALMILVKSGDLEKVSELFNRYHKQLYNFFVKLSFDRELAHDLTQSVFLRAMKYRKTFKEGHQFRAWIYQMARNLYADHYRKYNIRVSDHYTVEEVASRIGAVDERIVADEREKLLYLALYKLAPAQREVLILTRFQQMKYEEVAQVLGCSVGNVKIKVHRAIKQLRDKYLELEKI